IIDFIELSDDYSIIELSCPKKWVNKTMRELNIRSEFGINVIAVRGSNGKDVTVSPPANYKMAESDVLIVIGGNDELEELREL
ncbi:MAG: TrkA C-terminal domain-containing protein, partial [Clostridia bacterium]